MHNFFVVALNIAFSVVFDEATDTDCEDIAVLRPSDRYLQRDEDMTRYRRQPHRGTFQSFSERTGGSAGAAARAFEVRDAFWRILPAWDDVQRCYGQASGYAERSAGLKVNSTNVFFF